VSDFITNAELRIEAERLCDENESLKAENSKLRELVAVGLRCCDFKCDGCRFNKHNACYVGEFEDEARKLGVEVNG